MNAYVHIATSEGRGAIAVVRLWGEGALEAADRAFRPARGRPLSKSPVGRLRLGRAGAGRGDEVVAVRMESAVAPTIEFQCHGGRAAVNSVVAALEAAGARRWRGAIEEAGAGAFGPAAADDRIAAQALADLVHAPTLRVAEILLDQSRGALRRALEAIQEAMNDARTGPGAVVAMLDELIGRGAIGLRLIDGWRVAIAGRPNVGKSRLFNALAGFERSIVAPTPGATRDVVTLRAAFGGWPVELADTAGLRAATDAIETQGVERARRAHDDADLVLIVLDRSELLTDFDRELLAGRPNGLVVANKSDLPGAWKADEADLGPSDRRAVSAERGDGLAELIAAIVARLAPDPPPPEAGVPFRPEHLAALRSARDRWLAGDRAGAGRDLRPRFQDSGHREIARIG